MASKWQPIQLKIGTSAQWTAANPTLLKGEGGIESDTGCMKIGDGSTAWTSLIYFPRLKRYTVATLPNATSNISGMVAVTDETGGAVPAFSDGTDWRRVTDRAIVS
jgi:hypothetical protein